jgi:hypothetical protein
MSFAHVLGVLKDKGLDCLPCDRVNLDYERFAEYRDAEEHPADTPFENPPLETAKKQLSPAPKQVPSILRYFLDGSRRTYKVADVVVGNRYLPVVAGQIGVAVVGRADDNRSVAPLHDYCKFLNVIALPDPVGPADLAHYQEAISSHVAVAFEIGRYFVKEDRDPVDLAVAHIMKRMHDLEVEMVSSLASKNQLQSNSVLVVDGPLRFKDISGRHFDITQFRNVVGLSKTFRPSFRVGKGRGRKDVGSIARELEFLDRTSVFKTLEEERVLGMWYLRMRPRNLMANPLQGVVKLECLAIDPEENQSGLEADRIDILSSHILRERNVTPFGGDLRWAGHIYPIYLAEKYIKCSFMSDLRFKALF